MADLSWKACCNLKVGDFLYGENCIQAIEFYTESCSYYKLSVQDHTFFIYPGLYVHNNDFATISAEGLALTAGAIEVLNPVAILVGVVVPLSLYALRSYMTGVEASSVAGRGNAGGSQEKIFDSSVGIPEKTRLYYEVTRQALHSLYQDLVKMKNDVSFLFPSNQYGTFAFSPDLLSLSQFAAFSLDSLISVADEAALSLVEQQKLMQIRELELEKLQHNIYDIHLFLAFHISELINCRDQASNLLDEVLSTNQTKYINAWNQNRDRLWKELVLGCYYEGFVIEESVVNLARRIKELDSVCSYYSQLNNFFVTQTTNLSGVFAEQININQSLSSGHLALTKKLLYEWRLIDETYLRTHGLLSQELIRNFRNQARDFCSNFGKKIGRQAKDKLEVIKRLAEQGLGRQKFSGTGGGLGRDPDDDELSGVLGYFKDVFAHAFRKARGHLIDSTENRGLVLDMAKQAKNRLGECKKGNVWYAEILDNGQQLWASTRDNLIRNCGLNEIPLLFNQETGPCRNIVIKGLGK